MRNSGGARRRAGHARGAKREERRGRVMSELAEICKIKLGRSLLSVWEVNQGT